MRIDVKGYAEIVHGQIRRRIIHADQHCESIKRSQIFYIRLVSAPENEQPELCGLMMCRGCHAVPSEETQPELTDSVRRLFDKGVQFTA